MKKYILAFLGLFLLFTTGLHSQDEVLKDNSSLNQALSSSAVKKVNSTQKDFNKASQIMAEADVFEKEIDDIKTNSRRAKTRRISKLEEKKMQKEIQAYYLFRKGHKKLYQTYRKSMKDFWELSDDPYGGIDLEKDARTASRKAKKFRRKAENSGDTEKAYRFFTDAYTFDIRSINYLIEAFEHYQSTRKSFIPPDDAEDLPVPADSLAKESLTGPSDSVVLTEPIIPAESLPEILPEEIDTGSLSERVTDTLSFEEATEIPVETEPVETIADQATILPDTLVADSPALQGEITDTSARAVQEAVIAEPVKEEPVVVPDTPPDDIFFAIQILSKTSAATDAQLKQVYNGPEKPYLMQSGDYYRYMIGKFNTLFEAKVFQNREQVQGFIVAYRNGEKIPVQEAVELLKNK